MKHVKRVVSLGLVIVFVCAMSMTAFAATYYENHYTNGRTYGEFTITTTGSITQFTVQTQNFPSSSSIAVDIYNSNGRQVNQMGVWINGNGKVSNQPLTFVHPAGTYTVRYSVPLGGSGWIGVWLY